MKYTTALLLLALIAITLTFTIVRAEDEDDFVEDEDEGIKYSDSVVILTDDNFAEKTKETEYVLVEFYANWCPHCKNLAPEISKAADEIAETLPNVKIATLECDKNNKKCSEFQIPGFPTLKLFKNGEAVKDFEEGRQAQDIVNWLNRKTGPPAVSLADADAVSAFVKENNGNEVTAIVGKFTSKDSALYKEFQKAAEANDDFSFGEFVGADADSIQLFQYFSEEPKDISATESAGILDFVSKNGFPLVDEINAKTFRRFAEAGIPLAVFFYSYGKDADNKADYVKTLTAAAEQLVGKLNIGYSDADEFGQQMVQMGLPEDKVPGMAAMDIEKRTNYPYKGEFTTDAILAWGQGIVDGTVKPFLKSEPIPEESENQGPVRVVVGDSFEQEVTKSGQNVFVKFYADWCGHCKSLAPTWEKLGTYFKDLDCVKIAKLKATDNDVESVSIEGFPTLILWKSDGTQTPYDGGRDAKALKKFIYENVDAECKAQIKELVKANKANKKEEL